MSEHAIVKALLVTTEMAERGYDVRRYRAMLHKALVTVQGGRRGR